MDGKLSRRLAVRLMAACFAVSTLVASDYQGTVKSGGLPVPGVTITMVQGDQKIVTTTDAQGAFSVSGLADGRWTIDLQMLGFGRINREVDVTSGAPAVNLELRLLSEKELLASIEGTQAAAPARRERPAGDGPGPPFNRPGFQRVDVNRSMEGGNLAPGQDFNGGEIGDLNQNAANSFTLQGSMSSALGIGQQNDWGPRAPGMDPLGGPGMMGGPGQSVSSIFGDGRPDAEGIRLAGPGGGGPPPGGPGLRPGGPPGGPGPGGFGGPPGGGPGGGFGGGRGPGGGPGRFPGGGPPPGGPEWKGRPNARAFGNARRDRRNTYMGMAFFNLGNSALDARTYSVTGANLEKPAYANARAAVMFGGPLRIPKLIGVEKQIFFTFNYQIQRSRTGNVSNPVNMPTALERMGDFSQTLLQGAPVTIIDPTTGLPFASNTIPASRINSAATALLQYFPDPNLPFAARNYQAYLNGVNNSQNINSRVNNVRIGSKDRLHFGIGYQSGSSETPNLLQFTDTGSNRAINANLGWSRNITTRLINNLNYNFSRMRTRTVPYFAYTENVAARLGIAGTSQEPVNWGPPNLSFTNYGNLSDGNYTLGRNQTSAVSESLLWVRNAHNITFGGDFRRMQFNQVADSNGRGTYSFNGASTGYDLADFLLGVPTTGALRYGNADKYFRGSGYSTFINDDWRISPQFSLVTGLRWEYASPMRELYNRLVNLAVVPGFLAVSQVQPGQSALPDALVNPDRNNFSPRLGFAWRPRAKDSLIVRGGYGVYYNTSVYNLIAGNLAQQPPFARTLSVAGTAANPLSLENGFLLASALTNNSTYAVDPDYRIGYAQTWTISVQHDLPLSMFVTAGYLGTKGTRLDQQFLPNSVAPGAAASSLPVGFTYQVSNGSSIYHAAQFQLNRRFRSGLGWNAGYQFSKSIDNAGTGGRGQGNTPVAQNWLDLSAERGLSNFDARHNLSLQMQYSSGMGIAGGTLVNGWRGALLKNWTISGGFNVRSGNPFTVTTGGSRSQIGGTAVTNTVRADATGLPVDAPGMLFNTAAFDQPAAGEWGNAGRNTVPGPVVLSFDGSLGRIFPFGERRSADLQIQSQNLLNRVSITGWGTVLDSTTYGLATNAAPMRRVTVSLRFRF